MKLSLEYIAGLFDGEGWITVNKNKGSFVPTVGIKMNGFHLLEELNNKFQGYFATKNNYVNRPLTEWRLRGAFKVINFLTQIEPHLIIKKEQAQLCLKLCKTYSIRNSQNKWITPKQKMTEDLINLRQNFVKQIKEAKQKVL